MVTLTLSEQELQALKELSRDLKNKWSPAQINLFGSKFKGIANEEADLDVLIKLPFSLDQAIRRGIIHRVFDINLIIRYPAINCRPR
jgi:predicted nucleotidyltransferase